MYPTHAVVRFTVNIQLSLCSRVDRFHGAVAALIFDMCTTMAVTPFAQADFCTSAASPNSVDAIFSAGGGGVESRGRMRGCTGREDSWYVCLQSVIGLVRGGKAAMSMLLFRAPLTNTGNSSYHPWQEEEESVRVMLCFAEHNKAAGRNRS
jgi:hypothetical protein